MLVVPSGALDGVGKVGGETGGEEDEGGGAAVAREEDCEEGGDEEELELEGFLQKLGGGEAAESPVGAAKGGEDIGEVGGGEGSDDDKISSGDGDEEGGFEEAGTARAGGEKKGELDGDGEQRLMGFEGETDGGQQRQGDALRQREGSAGEVRSRGEEVRKHEENEDVVALAEVAGWEDAGDENEEEAEAPADGQGPLAEVHEPAAEEGARSGEEGDGELEGDGEREIEGVGAGDDEAGEPEGEGRI